MKGQRPSKDNGSRAKNPARVKCEAGRVAAAIRNRGEGHRREDEARPVGHLTLGMGRAMNPVRRGERTTSNSKAHYEGRREGARTGYPVRGGGDESRHRRGWEGGIKPACLRLPPRHRRSNERIDAKLSFGSTRAIKA